jgi:superfamily II DNA/RNA helicase
MNTGIQDGYNLAWKMALVARSKVEQSLLETYNEERLENAKHLLKTTDRIFDFAAGTDWLLEFLRSTVLPPIAKYVFSLDVVKKFAFPLLSQIGINYRHSSLSNHAGDEDFEVKAGDRMPYFLIDGKSVYDRLRDPRFHCLVFSSAKADVETLKTKLEDQYDGLIDFNAFPLDAHVSQIFGTNKPFSVLLRPDNQIGFISTDISWAEVDGYLRRFVGYL